MPTPRNESGGRTFRRVMDYSNATLIREHLHHYREYAATTLYEKQRRLEELSRLTGVALIATTERHLMEANKLIRGRAGNRAGTLSTWKVFFRWLVIIGARIDDPTIRLERPKLPRRKPRPAPDGEVHLALRAAAATDREMYLWLRLMRFSGWRCSDLELARLEWIRDEQGITIVSLTGKGGVDRDAPLDPQTARLLRPFLTSSYGPLFTRQDGEPYRHGHITKLINPYLHALGFRWTAHQIRHRAVTELYKVCHDPMVLAKLSGWASIRTAELYTELDMSQSGAFVAEVAVRYDQEHRITPSPSRARRRAS